MMGWCVAAADVFCVAETHPTLLDVRCMSGSAWMMRLQKMTPVRLEPTESSWVLRLLAQGLVTIGILATDMAAETTMALWAVPLSFAGAFWSWRRRDQRNVTVKFLLAIGMMVALVLFFRNLLFGGLNDTRLTLAQLLIQVQVLHSFDLPRRKDLGYSMVIGLILVSVASTLSQTMGFGLWLLLFLAIALPVLVMDYRSRLGLKHWAWAMGEGRSRWRGLPLLFLTIVALGLVLFAVMPRLPGYQIQTFPMSQQIETQQEFDQEQVLNPGYIGRGKGNIPGTRPGRGTAPETGKGEIDDTFYYGFNTKINQNLRGKMTEKVLMRVRSQAEGFWRVMAFDRYTGQGWEVSRNEQTDTLTRTAWTYQFYPPKWNSINRTKRVVQTYTMVADLPNVIPAMTEPKEVYFPTKEIAIDREDGLRSPVALTEGLTYTVVSDLPYRDRTLLQTARSVYTPKLVNATIKNPYTQIDPALKTKLAKLAGELLAQANRPITSDYEKALYLAQAVKQRYQIQMDLPFLDDQEDLVEAFFFKSKGGYPDHFATAYTMLLRSIDLSARLVTGFGPGQFNPFTGYYVVKNTDAYAMTEVYFHKHAWFTFDPLPGHPLMPPTPEEYQPFSALKAFWQWVAGWLPSPVTGWLTWVFGGLATFLAGLIGGFLRLFWQGWWGWFLGAIGLLSAALGGWLLWLGYQRWRYQRQLRRLAPMARLYQELVDWAGDQGIPKHPAQTPNEYARRLGERGFLVGQTVPQVITQAYLGWRYGEQSPADVRSLQQALRQLQRQRRQQVLQQLPQTLSRQIQRQYRLKRGKFARIR
jgi:protein-glutamine gamma-glutamyltransferase